MKARLLAMVGAAGVATLALVGCTETGDVVVPSSQDVTGIAVAGHGEVDVTPDTGHVTIGVEVTRRTVADAREEAAKAAEKVIDSVKRNRVDTKDVKTTGLSIYPQYDYSRNGDKPRITGYTVSNTVSITVRNLDQFSKVIDEAIAAGGDAVRLGGISFEVADRQKAIEQAREAAVKDAKAKAEQLAKATGVKLGTVLTISEVGGTQPPPTYLAEAKRAAGAADTATPVEPGTTKVSIDVQVRWSIE